MIMPFTQLSLSRLLGFQLYISEEVGCCDKSELQAIAISFNYKLDLFEITRL
jgi:hypothetical protein